MKTLSNSININNFKPKETPCQQENAQSKADLTQSHTLKSKQGWTNSEKAKISKVLTMLATFSETYGSKDLLKTIAGYELILAKKYTAEQVAYGIKKWAETNSKFPEPSDINNLLDPPKAQISHARYVQACQDYARNGYQPFCYHKSVMNDYLKQEAQKGADVEAARAEAKAIGQQENLRLASYD